MKKIDHPTFGTGGNSDSFYASGKKSTVQAPEWVKLFGLDAYEFEAGNGLNAGEATLQKIGHAAREHGILMSFHTPYFISLSRMAFSFRSQKSLRIFSSSIKPPPLLVFKRPFTYIVEKRTQYLTKPKGFFVIFFKFIFSLPLLYHIKPQISTAFLNLCFATPNVPLLFAVL